MSENLVEEFLDERSNVDEMKFKQPILHEGRVPRDHENTIPRRSNIKKDDIKNNKNKNNKNSIKR